MILLWLSDRIFSPNIFLAHSLLLFVYAKHNFPLATNFGAQRLFVFYHWQRLLQGKPART